MEEEKVKRYEELKENCPLFMVYLRMKLGKAVSYGPECDWELSKEESEVEDRGIEEFQDYVKDEGKMDVFLSEMTDYIGYMLEEVF